MKGPVSMLFAPMAIWKNHQTLPTNYRHLSVPDKLFQAKNIPWPLKPEQLFFLNQNPTSFPTDINIL